MKIHEYNQMMSYLTRPAQPTINRENFGEGTKLKLENFVKVFTEEKGRPPTIMEVADGSKSSTASIKKYLKEGADYIKTDLSEVGKKGGDVSGAKKKTGITKVSDKLVKDFKDLKIKGVSPAVETTKAGSKSFRIKFDKKLALKDIFVPATEENLNNLKNKIADVIDSDNYKENIKPFQTDAERLAANRFKQSLYRKQDPFRIYETLQKYKTEKFPDLSYGENIQHGQSKFSTQTLSRFGLLPREYNVKGPIKKIERIRDNYLKTTLATLENPNATAAAKKAAAEEYNSIVKGLRGQLKGTPVQGYVNFETFEVDNKGNYKKVKDIGFDPKKGMAFGDQLSDLDLSKITREQADEIIALGKKKIDLDLLQKTIPNLTTADKINRPQSALDRESFQRLSNKLKTQGGFVDVGAFADAAEDSARAIKNAARLYGPAAGKIAKTGLKVASGVVPAETIFIGDYQQQGYSPQEIALNVGTLGIGTTFKDINERADFVKSKGLGKALESALRKETMKQQARPVSGASAGIFESQPLTDDEQRALNLFRIDAQNIIDMRRAYQAGEYEKTDREFGINDPILRTGAMGGGIMRLGFADGPSDPSKRKFIKVMGGLASIPVFGKFFKVAEKAAPLVEKIKTPSLPGKPEWFDKLVNRVIAEGEDVTKNFGYKDRQTVHKKAINEAEEVRVYRDLDTGAVDVEYGPAGNRTSNDPEVISFEYKPGIADETTKGKKPPDEFTITEAEPRYVGGPGDTDIEFDGENIVNNVDDLMQDVSNLKQYATGEKLTLKETVDAVKKRKQFKEFSENQLDQAEYLENKYGPGPEPDIDDFIDE